jgi:hypothetical protein
MSVLKNEEQEGKQILSRGGYQWEGDRHKERVKKGNYGDSVLHSCVKIEQ